MKNNKNNKFTSVKRRDKKRVLTNHRLATKKSMLKRIKIVFSLSIFIICYLFYFYYLLFAIYFIFTIYYLLLQCGPRWNPTFKFKSTAKLHLNRNRSSNNLRRKKKDKYISKADYKRVMRMIPYAKFKKFKDRH